MTDNQDSLTGRLRAPHESSNLHSSLCRVWGAWALSTLCIIRMTRSGPYRLPYPYLSIPNLYISAPTLIQHSAITNVINLLSPLPLLANGGADDRADRPRRPDRDVRRFFPPKPLGFPNPIITSFMRTPHTFVHRSPPSRGIADGERLQR